MFECKLCGYIGSQVHRHFTKEHPEVDLTRPCLSCGKPVPYNSLSRGYKSFCNKSCCRTYKNKHPDYVQVAEHPTQIVIVKTSELD